MKLSLLFGGSRSGAFSSTIYSFLASFPVFFSSFFPPLAPFLFYSFFFYSYSICFLVNRGAFNICSYSSVKASPLYFLSSIKNFLLAFFALSALPGSASSQDFRVCFYLSYCLVSRTKAIDYWLITWAIQLIFSVSSFFTAA